MAAPLFAKFSADFPRCLIESSNMSITRKHSRKMCTARLPTAREPSCIARSRSSSRVGKGPRNIKSMWLPLAAIFLLPANKVCQGYVFTGVCLSTGGGGVHGCQGACVVAGGCAWLPGGMCGCWQGVCMVAWGCVWLLIGHVWLLMGEVCVVADGHVWLLGGMHGCWWGVHGCWQGDMHGCWEACMVAGGRCAWLPGGIHGEGGHAW